MGSAGRLRIHHQGLPALGLPALGLRALGLLALGLLALGLLALGLLALGLPALGLLALGLLALGHRDLASAVRLGRALSYCFAVSGIIVYSTRNESLYNII
jgi:hypothetical protein